MFGAGLTDIMQPGMLIDHPNDLLVFCVCFCCHRRNTTNLMQQPRCFMDKKLRETVFKLQVALRYYKTKQQMKPKPPHQRTTHKKGGGDASSKHIRNQVLNAFKAARVLLNYSPCLWLCVALPEGWSALLGFHGSKPARTLVCMPFGCVGISSLNWVTDLSCLHTCNTEVWSPPDYISRGDMNTLDWF